MQLCSATCSHAGTKHGVWTSTSDGEISVSLNTKAVKPGTVYRKRLEGSVRVVASRGANKISNFKRVLSRLRRAVRCLPPAPILAPARPPIEAYAHFAWERSTGPAPPARRARSRTRRAPSPAAQMMVEEKTCRQCWGADVSRQRRRRRRRRGGAVVVRS